MFYYTSVRFILYGNVRNCSLENIFQSYSKKKTHIYELVFIYMLMPPRQSKLTPDKL